MRFLVDADLPPLIALRLKELGHDCIHVREIRMSRAADEEIFALAQKEERTIITKDGVFANIYQYPLSTHNGVIRVRARGLHREELAAMVVEFISKWREGLQYILVVLEPGYVRVRRE